MSRCFYDWVRRKVGRFTLNKLSVLTLHQVLPAVGMVPRRAGYRVPVRGHTLDAHKGLCYMHYTFVGAAALLTTDP